MHANQDNNCRAEPSNTSCLLWLQSQLRSASNRKSEHQSLRLFDWQGHKSLRDSYPYLQILPALIRWNRSNRLEVIDSLTDKCEGVDCYSPGTRLPRKAVNS